MNVLIIVGVHGEETQPLEAMQGFSMPFVIANPRAIVHKRFVVEDLNRCFPGDPNGTYEERRAAKLVALMQKAEVVLDIHTTTVETEPFVIATKDAQCIPHIALSKVVYMPEHIANKRSLIDFHKNAVSLEFPETTTTKEIRTVLVETIKNISENKKVAQDYFEVHAHLSENIGPYKSFDKCGNEYVILYGKRPHLRRYGYRARKLM